MPQATGGPRPRLSIALRHRALDLALRVALLDRAALVVEVLALRHGQLDLCARAAPVEARGHDREALLGGRAEKAKEIAAVQEELARALRLVVVARGLVRRDVHVAEPDLAVAHLGVGVLQLDAALPDRLHLGPLQHDPRLELLEQVEAEARLPVRGDVARCRLALALLGHATSMTLPARDQRDRAARPRGQPPPRSDRPGAGAAPSPRPPARSPPR